MAEKLEIKYTSARTSEQVRETVLNEVQKKCLEVYSLKTQVLL